MGTEQGKRDQRQYEIMYLFPVNCFLTIYHPETTKILGKSKNEKQNKTQKQSKNSRNIYIQKCAHTHKNYTYKVLNQKPLYVSKRPLRKKKLKQSIMRQNIFKSAINCDLYTQ